MDKINEHLFTPFNGFLGSAWAFTGTRLIILFNLVQMQAVLSFASVVLGVFIGVGSLIKLGYDIRIKHLQTKVLEKDNKHEPVLIESDNDITV
jgi:hypothetical protein